MQTKVAQLASGESVCIPLGLSPEVEAKLIASFEPEVLTAECREIWRQHEAGELIPFEEVLAELFNPTADGGPAT